MKIRAVVHDHEDPRSIFKNKGFFERTATKLIAILHGDLCNVLLATLFYYGIFPWLIKRDLLNLVRLNIYGLYLAGIGNPLYDDFLLSIAITEQAKFRIEIALIWMQ